jgi:hypothetical protein
VLQRDRGGGLGVNTYPGGVRASVSARLSP